MATEPRPSLTAKVDLGQLNLFSDGDPHFDIFKDSVLYNISEHANTAQFVSFGPGCVQRFAAIAGVDRGFIFNSPLEAIRTLLRAAPEGQVNVRSFKASGEKGQPFVYGIREAEVALAEVRRLTGSGLYAIVNETIDVADGGVSGVIHGDVMEVAPGDTPRCVEKPGVATMDRRFGVQLLKTIYGAGPVFENLKKSWRVEFSLHPIARGYRKEHTIVWEINDLPAPTEKPVPSWPNRLSQACGDKAYGLLVAHLLGFAVPFTYVMPRAVPAFHFGKRVGTSDVWVRTCPKEQVPGKFATMKGWVDPFRLMQSEDPDGTSLASLIIQEGVEPNFSGAAATLESGEALIEGVKGVGTDFMLGNAAPEVIPHDVQAALRMIFDKARHRVGPIRFEWVYDGNTPWVVQIHRQQELAPVAMIVPGDAKSFRRFETSLGLERLRHLISEVLETGEGIELVGKVGRTSHICDLLRQAKVPSRYAS